MRMLVFALVCGIATSASAQVFPTEPITLGGGRIVLGAEVTATAAPVDEGFFNYTGYDNALRSVRLGVNAEVRASDRLQLLAEIRTDSGEMLEAYGLYARVRPWPQRRFDIQAGRIPPTFGAFGRGAYGSSNLLIGYPLAYQYLLSLRTDALPRTSEELVRMRGRGWRSNFTMGNYYEGPGVPIVNAFEWDTGIQVHGVNSIFEWTGALTTGSLSNPRVTDDNDGRQVSTRIVARPYVGLNLGVSAARGAFLSRSLETALPATASVDNGVQTAYAVDAEYSIGHFLTRAEVIQSRWSLPVANITGSLDRPLTATSWLTEARYRILPGVQVAGRFERLGFNRILNRGVATAWEAPVRRYEVGAGWSIIRNVIVKTAVQRNVRQGGRERANVLGAVQVIYWF